MSLDVLTFTEKVISRLTVFEDGTLEAECGPVPCGEVGRRCIEDQTSCRADTDVFSGMRWAPNGQSVLLRCCTIKVPNKIYVGTDLVTAGSYYEGGPIAKKDMYYPKGKEYDFIANVRTEHWSDEKTGTKRTFPVFGCCQSVKGKHPEEPLPPLP
ncbi:hypothetical protein ANCCEY_06998 [Ancylostoma ceylanicum]|uniref:Uncharacterized protein n=1 Tax=Ancylostoma ceylanicum TaxID=53326 RepID=A0A0D6LRS2_9BILA|nr:hypothetical protein ANCCEY_06998 [Ancylostoma ceylanicum]